MVKKRINVVGAVIEDDNKIFVAERAYGFLKGKWEFPGGKVEEGETKEQALIREIEEELDSEIKVDKYITTVDYEYETFFLHMDVYLCNLVSGALKTKENEHLAAKWVNKTELKNLDWCPADKIIIPEIEKLYK